MLGKIMYDSHLVLSKIISVKEKLDFEVLLMILHSKMLEDLNLLNNLFDTLMFVFVGCTFLRLKIMKTTM